MVFLASNGALSDVLEQASRQALSIKGYATQLRDRLAAGPVSAADVIAASEKFQRSHRVLGGYAATDGIVAYAQANTPGAPVDYDVAAEWAAMMSALDGVLAWIRTNFPDSVGDGSGFLLARQWSDGETVYRSFTAAQTGGLRAQLDALIAAIG